MHVSQVKGSEILFSIEDIGIGIDPNLREFLMQEFTQTDSSISRRYGGTGLGLAITKNLLEGLGSMLEIASSPGRGAQFYFTIDLPSVSGIVSSTSRRQAEHSLIASAVESAETQVSDLLAGKRVLVVDDNKVNRQVARKILESFGLMVMEAEDGVDCLEIIKKQTLRYDFHGSTNATFGWHQHRQ
jgi:CheY-like chemotaxis protein